ncbi:MAG TPA: heparinase II/III family protein [Armatimonadota bacterium]|nr:heparinase II/III family protein [Armatimonadota bacterium]
MSVVLPSTRQWTASEDGQAFLQRRCAKAAKAFQEPGIHERLRQEAIASQAGGTKVYRIGNSLRQLSQEVAMLAMGQILGVETAPAIWDIIDTVFFDTLLSVGPMNFQGRTQQNPAWKSDLWTADIGANLALISSCRPPIAIETATLETFIKTCCFQPILEDWVNPATRIHSLDSMGHNWWSVIVSGAGMMAALMNWTDDLPVIRENMVQWFRFPGNDFSRKRPNFGPQGDFVEGFGYAEYGLLNACRMSFFDPEFPIVPNALSLEQVQGLVGWLKHAFIQTDDGVQPMRFSDVTLNHRPRTSVWHQLYRMTHDDELLALVHRMSPEPSDAFDIALWEPKPAETVAVTRNTTSTPAIYPTSGLAFLTGNDLSVGVRAGEFWNHNHLDAGSFIYADAGVIWIDDAGTCTYSDSAYDDYYVAPQAHNVAIAPALVPLVRRCHFEGMPLTGHFVTGTGDRLVQVLRADTNVLAGGALARSYRQFLLLGQKVMVIWDDLSAYDEQPFESLLHTTCQVHRAVDNGLITLSHGEKSCPLYCFASVPSELSLQTMPMGEIAHDHAETREGTCLSWQSVEATRVKFGVAMGTQLQTACWTALPADGGWTCRLSTAEENWQLWFNPRADGRVMHQNCISQWNGMETDAYALIQHDGPDGRMLTMLDGSFVRTPAAVLHSSLSRQSLVSVDD